MKIGLALLEIMFPKCDESAAPWCTALRACLSSVLASVPSILASVCVPESTPHQCEHNIQRAGVKWASAKQGIHRENKMGQGLGAGRRPDRAPSLPDKAYLQKRCRPVLKW